MEATAFIVALKQPDGEKGTPYLYKEIVNKGTFIEKQLIFLNIILRLNEILKKES